MRGVALVIATALLPVLAFPALAGATTRYAVPGGNSGHPNCTTPSNGCSIQDAFDAAATDDEIVIMHGRYDLASGVATTKDGLNVHGEDGQPRPEIRVGGGDPAFTMLGDNANGVVRHLHIEQTTTGTSGNDALGVRGGSSGYALIENVEAVTRSDERSAIGISFGSVKLFSSSAFAPGANATALSAGVSSGVASNVTAIAPGTGGVGLRGHPICQFFSCSGDSEIFVDNSILDGGPGGFDVKTESVTEMGACSMTCYSTVNLASSNYESAENCSGCTVTQPGTGQNQTAAPQLVDASAGDFHQRVSSPTRDAGVAASSARDLDGDPRSLGSGPDIGADEYNGPPIADTLPATNVGSSTARLNAAVMPLGFETSVHFQWGATTAYGNRTPAGDLSAGSGEGSVNVFADAAGLPPGTLVNYRVVATNLYGGTAFGDNETFTTGPAPAAAPAFRFRGVRLRTLALTVRNGFVVVRIECPAGVIGRCLGRIVLRTLRRVLVPARTAGNRRRARKRKVTLGRASFSIPAGRTGRVRVRLSRSALKLLRRTRRLTLVATMTATANGQRRTTRRNATIRVPRKR